MQTTQLHNILLYRDKFEQHTIAEDVFIWSVGSTRSVNRPLTALWKSSYLLT